MTDNKINILIVDDFGTLRRIIKNTLKQGGYNYFTEAENGKKALEYLEQDSFDLILSDWNMSEMDGLELLRAVRSNEKLKHIPFLMITAEGTKENVVQAIAEGVTNYIIKPFTQEMLLNKIGKILN